MALFYFNIDTTLYPIEISAEVEDLHEAAYGVFVAGVFAVVFAEFAGLEIFFFIVPV